jgi:5'-3' exonuclease
MINNNLIPVILIDTSYTSFYRFYATIRWYSFAFPEEFNLYNNDINYDWSTNTIFIEKYEKMYLESIIKIIKKKIFSKSHIIFCMDSPIQNIWRTIFFEEYKSNRKKIPLKYNYKNVFNYTYDYIIPKIINEYNNIKSIRLDEVEADDIIACICIYMKNYNKKIYIISGDDDFLQLGRENVLFLNYKNKKSIILTEDEAKIALKKKIILGDKSDGIAGIYEKGFKVKKKDLLNDEILELYLDNNANAKKKYEFNKKMIDFNYIPKKYYNKIIILLNKNNI